jgi:FkbM family methyltransferase
MNKNFFKRPFYNMAGKISKMMRNFQKKRDDKIIKVKNKTWEKLFKGEAFFEYFITKDVKINLYQDSILSRLIHEGFEKEETDYVASVLNKGDIFIDIGTNIGLFSLIASKIVGEEGKVICFEPSPHTYNRLVENVKLNNFKNIDHRNIGLSNIEGNLVFYISENGHDAWNSFAPSQDGKLEKSIVVPVATLDAEIEKMNKDSIKLIKIDVEGWEKFVLYGGEGLFVNYSPIVMVEFTEENTYNAGYSVYEIYDIMEKWGYVWYRINKGKLTKEIKKMNYPYDNLIAIKGN